MNNILPKETIHKNIIDFISSPYSNRIAGFSDLTGYWKKKSEILFKIPPQNLKTLYEVITESFNTVEDVVKECRIALNEKLKPYAITRPGRKSNWEIKLRRIRTNITSHSKERFEFIQIHKFLAGLCVGENLDRKELENYAKKIEENEIKETNSAESNLSNAQFRLEIFYSFVKGTSYEDIAFSRIRNIAKRILEHHQIDLLRVEKESQKLNTMHKIVNKFAEEYEVAKKIAKELEERLKNSQEVYRKEANILINGLTVSKILKLKAYSNEQTN